jgi:hypothetical protein
MLASPQWTWSGAFVGPARWFTTGSSNRSNQGLVFRHSQTAGPNIVRRRLQPAAAGAIISGALGAVAQGGGEVCDRFEAANWVQTELIIRPLPAERRDGTRPAGEDAE